MRIASRFIASIASVLMLTSAGLAALSGPASATAASTTTTSAASTPAEISAPTPYVFPRFNVEMTYGQQFTDDGTPLGVRSQTNQYDPSQKWDWYNDCYQVDCGGLQVGENGISLKLVPGETFVSASVYYESNDYSLYAGRSWDGKGSVDLNTPDTVFGHTTMLHISYVNVLVLRDGFPVMPDTCPAGETCRGGGMK